jgi:hypothetical protein
MSHTSQRRGLTPDRPGREMVVLAMVPARFKGVPGVGAAMAEAAMLMLEHGPDNWVSRNFTELEIPGIGAARAALQALKQESPTLAAKTLMRTVGQGSSVVAAVYTDLEPVVGLLQDLQGTWLDDLRKKGVPISIVLSGLFGDIHSCCGRTGLKEHTYLHSLGFRGTTERLPSDTELELLTMCGHGLVSINRMRALVRDVGKGLITPEEAAHDIAKPCVCGIVNMERAAKVFARLAHNPNACSSSTA